MFVSPLLILSIILIKLTKADEAAFDSNILLKFRLDSRLPIDGKIKLPRWRNCELEFLLVVIFCKDSVLSILQVLKDLRSRPL